MEMKQKIETLLPDKLCLQSKKMDWDSFRAQTLQLIFQSYKRKLSHLPLSFQISSTHLIAQMAILTLLPHLSALPSFGKYACYLYLY